MFPPIIVECLLFGVRFTGANVQKWPFPAVQAMKSIRGRPTASCDPGCVETLDAVCRLRAQAPRFEFHAQNPNRGNAGARVYGRFGDFLVCDSVFTQPGLKAVVVDFKPMLCRLGKADINGWRNRQGSPERSGG